MSIYIFKNNQQLRPFDENQVLEMLRNDLLSPDNLAIREGEIKQQSLSAILPNTVIPPKSRKIPFGFILISIVSIIFAGMIYLVKGDINRKTETINREIEAKDKSEKEKAEKVQSFVSKFSEMIILSPPEKLAPQPYTNGKIIFVGTINKEPRFWGYDYPFYGPDGNKYLSKEEELQILKYFNNKFELKGVDNFSRDIGNLFSQSLAQSADDAKTIVQISFEETDEKQEYGYISYDSRVTIHGISCKVVVIDKTIPAIIAKKTFVNNNFPKEIQVSQKVYQGSNIHFDSKPGNPALMYPFEDVLNYLKKFKKR